MQYTVTGITHIGKVRSVNQDNFYCEGNIRSLENNTADIEKIIVDDRRWIVAVFDGLGGEADGEIASLVAAETSKELCSDENGCEDPGELIMEINSRICKEKEERKCRMGSTCVFLEFDRNKCRSWNVGDSKSYLYSEGRLTQLSEDHTEAAWYASFFNDNSVLKSARESRLTQCLGIPASEFLIEPSFSPWNAIKDHDIMLLCSDGLTHASDDDEICKILSEDTTLNKKRDELLELALSRGGADNITIFLIEAIDWKR